MNETVYSVTSPEPTTPEGVFAKALAHAFNENPALTAALVAASAENSRVDVLDQAVERALPKSKAGTATKATLAMLRELHVAIGVDTNASGVDVPAGDA